MHKMQFLHLFILEVIPMDIVDRMFELIDAQYKEQRDFATAIGVDASHISRWRNRKTSSYQRRLPQIAEALGTTTEYLLTGEGPKKRICSNPTALSDLPDEALDVARAYDCADEKSRAMVRLALGLDKDI